MNEITLDEMSRHLEDTWHGGGNCNECGEEWPCRDAELLAYIRGLEAARDAARALSDYIGEDYTGGRLSRLRDALAALDAGVWHFGNALFGRCARKAKMTEPTPLTAADESLEELRALASETYIRRELDISRAREAEKDGFPGENAAPRDRFNFLLWAHFDKLLSEITALREALQEIHDNPGVSLWVTMRAARALSGKQEVKDD